MSYTRVPYTEEQKRRDQEHLKDVEFFNKNSKELMNQYPEQWIGILGQKVVVSAPDVYDLIAQLKKKGISREVALWRHMTRKEEIVITRLWDPDYA